MRTKSAKLSLSAGRFLNETYAEVSRAFIEEIQESLGALWDAKKVKILKEKPLEMWRLGLLLNPTSEVFDRNVDLELKGTQFFFTVTEFNPQGARTTKLASGAFNIHQHPQGAARVIDASLGSADYEY